MRYSKAPDPNNSCCNAVVSGNHAIHCDNPVALAVSGHGGCPRVAAGLARGSTVRVPRWAGGSSFLTGCFPGTRLAEAGCEYGDLGFPGDGCLGRGSVREFRACFLGAF